jgi:Sec-independent protein translocase protein TatA
MVWTEFAPGINPVKIDVKALMWAVALVWTLSMVVLVWGYILYRKNPSSFGAWFGTKQKKAKKAKEEDPEEEEEETEEEEEENETKTDKPDSMVLRRRASFDTNDVAPDDSELHLRRAYPPAYGRPPNQIE